MERIRTEIYLVSSNETSDAKTTKFYTAALTTVQLNPRAQKEGEKDAMRLVDSDANDSIFEISHKKKEKKKTEKRGRKEKREKEIPIELHSRPPSAPFLFYKLFSLFSSTSRPLFRFIISANVRPRRPAAALSRCIIPAHLRNAASHDRETTGAYNDPSRSVRQHLFVSPLHYLS